jgi:hypothetical protein
MSQLRFPPLTLDAGKEADSGRGRTVLLPARAPSAGARQSSLLVMLPPPRATPSGVGALIAPCRSPPPGNRAAAWPQRQGSATLVGREAERQRRHWHRRSRPRWRVGCCRVLARMPVVLVRGRAAGRQLDDARAGHHSPHGGCSCTGMSCAGRRSRGSTSMPSSW